VFVVEQPGALPPLIVDFCGLPQDLVAPVLMTWDFLSWFASLAQQPVISQLFANVRLSFFLLDVWNLTHWLCG
jgi:hypothetical protein